ncbi:hypothetical protein [Ruminococcus albus]|uniref:DUF5082 domain-containing protein n=1 Tax=Ruminococcus albus TaxID=1264 RepID=A0A1I1HYH3_RUMAL|nr:hypothetical protein [Ruminococcus albus]SFC28936.1 hypothetical protein SAMN02910406_01454 [Ruminococcus albus]
MSWINPSQEEASDSYYNARSRYVDAANQYNSNSRALDSCRSEMSGVQNQFSSCRSDKINFEKRIEELGTIIGCLEGSGGWFAANVPDSVSSANSSAQKAGEGFSQCIKCDSIAAPDLGEVFKCKTVEEDADSSSALQSYKSEKSRLEQAVAELNARLQQLEERANELVRNMNSMTAQQHALKKAMNSCSYDMAHYKKYM